jgi:hypothetical protein
METGVFAQSSIFNITETSPFNDLKKTSKLMPFMYWHPVLFCVLEASKKVF